MIARLNKSLIKAIQAPEFSGKMAEIGVLVNPSSSEEAEAYARKQLADWAPILERRNIKLD